MAAPPRPRWSWRSRSGRALLWQLLVVGVIVALLALLVAQTVANMHARGIHSGFGFLAQSAGFDISEGWFGYQPSDPIWKALGVGLLNTLRVAIPAIVATTLLGTLLGIARFSSNVLARGLAQGYVELFRNIPLLLQLLMWYLLLVEYLPDPQQPLALGQWFLLSKSGLAFPTLTAGGLSLPRVDGFAIEGGASISPEFLALLLGLTLYTAAFVAEIVRGGIAALPRGQLEAAASLGLSRTQTLRLVTLPQALRVIIPPLTNQYLNLTKNSSLAVAIGYPELVSVANTTLNQSGRAVECIAIIMAVYLLLSLLTALVMGIYNRRALLPGA